MRSVPLKVCWPWMAALTPLPCLPCHGPACQAKLKQHSAEVERDASRARARLQQLQAALAKVQHQQHAAERRARAEGQQVAELEAKQQEYGKTLEKCARKLAANGAVPEVSGLREVMSCTRTCSAVKVCVHRWGFGKARACTSLHGCVYLQACV
jgi:hypothetical protein